MKNSSYGAFTRDGNAVPRGDVRCLALRCVSNAA